MNGRMYNIIISIFCIGIIFFIFLTRCKVSKIQLKMKDSSLILILFALLAYINGHEYLFLILLIAFSIIYFTPQHYFDNYLSRFLGKKYKKVNEENIKPRPQEPPQEPTIETIETDIEIDDNITLDEEFDEQENQEQQYEEQQYEEQQYQNQQDKIEK